MPVCPFVFDEAAGVTPGLRIEMHSADNSVKLVNNRCFMLLSFKYYKSPIRIPNCIALKYVVFMQRIYQILAGYFNYHDADELTTGLVFCAVPSKDALASPLTMPRFFNRLDEDSLVQFEKIFRVLRQKIYGIRPPENILLDLDSTLLQTYGHQEGEGFNYHYQNHGYHPLLYFDGLTGDLLEAALLHYNSGSCEM